MGCADGGSAVLATYCPHGEPGWLATFSTLSLTGREVAKARQAPPSGLHPTEECSILLLGFIVQGKKKKKKNSIDRGLLTLQ